MESLFNSSLFGIVLSIVAFEIGVYINRKTNSSLANPLMLAVIIIISFLLLFDIPLEQFQKGGNIIGMFLAPATAALAVNIYKNYNILKSNIVPVIVGTGVGSLASMGSIFLMCKLFGLDQIVTASLIPKSVTTPIAMEVATSLGGESSITTACVVFTGILGSMLAPSLIKLIKVKNPVSAGLAIGTCSHAIGTTKALELGEIEGAMSGLAIGVAGFLTVVFSMFL